MTMPRPAYILLLVALTLRGLFVWSFYHNPRNIRDVDAHVALGTALYERGEFSEVPGVPSIEAPVGFPLWIALLFTLFGKRLFIVFAFNVVLSVATCAVAFVIGKRLFSERTGLLALASWSFYPYSIYYCGWSFPETLTTLLVAVDLLCLGDWYGRRTPGRAAACGALAAMTALTNPASLVFLGLVPVGLLAAESWRKALRHAPFYYLLLVVCYLPWPIRNQLAFGRPVLTNIHGGMNLYQALVVPPDAFGTPEEGRIYRADAYYQSCVQAHARNEYLGAYDMFMSGAVRLIREHPGRYLLSVARRGFKLWRLFPYRRSYPFGYWKIFLVSLLSDGLIIPLGLLGLFSFRGRWRDFLPLYAAAGLWTLAYSLVYVVMRFRLPVMMVPILFAAAWVQRIVEEKA